jgi:hypothetical protein
VRTSCQSQEQQSQEQRQNTAVHHCHELRGRFDLTEGFETGMELVGPSYVEEQGG